MPRLGEIKKGTEIGYKNERKSIWLACVDCGKERWVEYIKGKKTPRTERCKSCAAKRGSAIGINHRSWKGGRRKTKQGYILVKIYKDDFFGSMLNVTGYVMEHRLVMAKHLGRCLQKWEVAHHKNGIKDDNRIENLELTTQNAHHKDHSKGYRDGYTKGLIDGRCKQIKLLKDEIEALKSKDA